MPMPLSPSTWRTKSAIVGQRLGVDVLEHELATRRATACSRCRRAASGPTGRLAATDDHDPRCHGAAILPRASTTRAGSHVGRVRVEHLVGHRRRCRRRRAGRPSGRPASPRARASRSPVTAASTVHSCTTLMRRRNSPMIPGTVVVSRPRTPAPSAMPMISTTEPSGRFVTLPSFGQVHRAASAACR